MTATKETNPKDLVGSKKAPLSTLPFRVLWRVGLAMLEGMCKYGRHNYRAAGARASVYFDGAQRHLGGWWEGEDIDPDSGFNHIDKLIANLMVLRDSMLQGNWIDDRPPRAREDFPALHAEAARIVELHKDKSPRHYTIADTEPEPEPTIFKPNWVEWRGSGIRPPNGTRVYYRMRGADDVSGPTEAIRLRWHHENKGSDIVAYAVVE
jgi:hypothetical protein